MVLFAFVSGGRSRRRLSEKQAVFVRAFAGGVAAFGLIIGLDLLRFWLAPGVPALTWIGVCMAFYAAFVAAGLTVWFMEPKAHSVFESGRDRLKRELTRLYWVTAAAVLSAFVARPPSLSDYGGFFLFGMLLIIGLLAFVHSYHVGRRDGSPSHPGPAAGYDGKD